MFKKARVNKEKALWFSLIIVLIVAVFVGLISRFINLAQISEKIFDEVYFTVFANDFLHRKLAFDVHPPLGKLFIAIGIWFFGDNALGWRIIPAIFGVGNMILFYFLGKKCFHREKGSSIFGLMALFLLSIEPIFIIYSRVGLMDGILFFFIFLSLILAYRVRSRRDILALSVVIGLAVAIKWVALAVIIPVMFIMWQKRKLNYFLTFLSFTAVVYILAVWIGMLIGGQSLSMNHLIEWNIQAFNYHHNLKDTHPWGSAWWSWPLMLRPLLMWYDQPMPGIIRIMTAMGNPIIWLTSTATVVVSMLYVAWLAIKKWSDALHHPLTPLLIGYFSFLLPWALVTRVVFIYHYLPCYGFALLMLAYWLGEGWHKNRAVALIVMLVLLISSIFFIPMATGTGMSQNMVDAHIWLKSWLY